MDLCFQVQLTDFYPLARNYVCFSLLYTNLIKNRMEKKSFFENISEIGENLMLYIETNVSLYKLIALEKAVKALTVVVSNTFIILFLVLSLIFFSAAAALYFGRILESTELGLLIVAGGYFLLGIVFYVFKKQIFSRLIIKFLINIFVKDDEDEKHNGLAK